MSWKLFLQIWLLTIVVMLTLSLIDEWEWERAINQSAQNTKISYMESEENAIRELEYEDKKEISPNGLFETEEYTDKLTGEYRILLRDLEKKETKIIFSNVSDPISWKWLDDNRIFLKDGCGTGCSASKIISPIGDVSMEDPWRREYYDGRNDAKVKYYVEE